MSASASVLSRQRHCLPDEIYERRWALSVLDQVLARLGDEYRAAGPASRDCLIGYRSRSRMNPIVLRRRTQRTNSG